MEFIGRFSKLVQDGILSDIKVHSLELVDTIYISELKDLPTPINNIITLEANKTYFITNDLDIGINRLYCPSVNALIGYSSEVSFLRSSSQNPLITSDDSLPIRHITLVNTVGDILDLDGSRGDNQAPALDWFGVNFTGTLGTIKDYTNVIILSSAFLSSQNLTFDGSIGTIGFDTCLFSPVANDNNTSIIIPESLIISRRFRIIYSSFIIIGTNIGINFSSSASVNTESYILDTVNFSGGGTYISGVPYSDNKALFKNNVGISNSSVLGQMSLSNNASATVISNTTNYFKVAGVTVTEGFNEKYTMTDNRLTNNAIIERSYLAMTTLSFTSGNNNVVEFAYYDSKEGDIRTASRVKSTANASGRAENITLLCIFNHSENDYIEVHCRNISASNNVTVDEMNCVITEIN